jgi:3-dehydroquinate dehydratase-1
MFSKKQKYLAGLVDPEVLSAIEADPMHPVFLDLQACSALEIRYDFFDEALWPGLSERVRKIAPHAMQIGTIRLKRDGGVFQDSRAGERMPLREALLEADQVPDWLDLEQDCLYDYEILDKLTKKRGTKILVSQHNFSRVPTALELRDFARDVARVGASGLKIAAMCNAEEDCERLYDFCRRFGGDFELFAAFGMGDCGRVSRIWSLKEGANLTYGSMGCTAAPGLIEVPTMARALERLPDFNSRFEIATFLAGN